MNSDGLLARLEAHLCSFCKGAVADFDEQLAPNFVDDAAPLQAPAGPTFTALASTMLSSAFPDLRITLEDVVVGGRLIAARSRWRGINTGAS